MKPTGPELKPSLTNSSEPEGLPRTLAPPLKRSAGGLPPPLDDALREMVLRQHGVYRGIDNDYSGLRGAMHRHLGDAALALASREPDLADQHLNAASVCADLLGRPERATAALDDLVLLLGRVREAAR